MRRLAASLLKVPHPVVNAKLLCFLWLRQRRVKCLPIMLNITVTPAHRKPAVFVQRVVVLFADFNLTG